MRDTAKALLTALLLPSATAAGTVLWGKLSRGDWLAFYRLVPAWLYVLVLTALLLWVTAIAIRTLNVSTRAARASGPWVSGGGMPVQRRKIGERAYESVIWDVYQAEHFRATMGISWVSEIEVDIQPRCPQCKTELNERTNILQYKVWSCPNCRWFKWSVLDWYEVANDVEKVVRREVERQMEDDARRSGGG